MIPAWLRVALQLVALVTMPWVLVGVVNRTKALWGGRRGAPILQPLWDVLRLLRKRSVYSETTTPLFRIAPWVLLVTSCASALVVPLCGLLPVLSFPFDFVWFAYVWGLGRLAQMLAALDTGSSFEGMGASREATFSTLIEPALFLVLGALALGASTQSLHPALLVTLADGPSITMWLAAVIALFIVLTVETARLPVDDPTTHLELTMVHEVMILDHSGAELGAMQASAALKLYTAASVLATLLNPLAARGGPLTVLGHLGLCLLIAVALGTLESLIARFKLRSVPQYIVVAIGCGVLALLATAWRLGGGA